MDYQKLKNESKEEYRNRIIKGMIEQKKQIKDDLVSGDLKVSFDVDDFGFLLPGFDDLLRLKNSFDNFKITCFTIPLPGQFFFKENAKHFKTDKYKKWAETVNSYDWIEIAIHGFAHTLHEADCNYTQMMTMLDATENLLKEIGLNYNKMFRAPYWQYSYDTLMVLKERGYTVAIDRNNPIPIPEGLKTYTYNWSFEENLPIDKDIIKGHGHFIGNNKNNISTSLDNIQKQIPHEAQFKFISEINDEKK